MRGRPSQTQVTFVTSALLVTIRQSYPPFRLFRRIHLKRIAVSFVVALLVCSTAGLAQEYTWELFAGSPGGAGWYDGAASEARFSRPAGIAVDSSGNVYVAESRNCTIRKVTPDGTVTTLAGVARSCGYVDGPGSEARFSEPHGLAIDGSRNLYVSDRSYSIIRKVTPLGEVTTLAGEAGSSGSADGTGSAARFSQPAGLCVDANGDILVADYYNHTIRKITPAGVVTTVAGLAGVPGSADGTGSAARFKHPAGLAVDGSGNIYISDSSNQTIRKMTPGGVVTTVAGLAGSTGSADGAGAAARFLTPWGIVADAAGNLTIADQTNHTIRRMTPAGVVTTFAGLVSSRGSSDGTGSAARFDSPSGVSIDRSGNLYVTDWQGHAIRKITPAAVVTTFAGRASASGSVDATGSAARFNYPSGLTTDAGGNVYVADMENQTVRKVTPAGAVTTLAGMPGTYGSADGTGSAARFDYPWGAAVDGSGNIYVSDVNNFKIRKVTQGGVVTSLAGSGSFGTSDGAGSAASFGLLADLTVDGSGNIYAADYYSHTIRKVTPAGVVTTFAGTAAASGSSDGTGSAARFHYPYGVAVGSGGNLFVADTGNQTIRKATPAAAVTTFAGTAGGNGSGDGTGSAARFSSPLSLATDSSGNIYVADGSLNYMIRKITPAAVVTTIGGTVYSDATVDGTGSEARFTRTAGLTVAGSGNVYVADVNAIRVGRPTTLADRATVTPNATVIYSPVTLGTAPQTATSWSWSVVRRPAHSFAPLSSAAIASPSFTPDRPGLYTFLLRAEGAGGVRYSSVDLNVTGTVAAPLITSITPDDGTHLGGATMTIAGSNFAYPVVTIGGASATVISSTSTEIVIATPQLTPGTRNDVVVANGGAEMATLPGAWFADFVDVPASHPYQRFVEAIVRAGITGGCGSGSFCVNGSVTRSQMAVFLLTAKHGAGWAPGAATGTLFADVAAGSFAASWIEQVYAEGITGGCATDPLRYCPGNSVTRAQMAVFLLAAFDSTLSPPPATGVFSDVPTTSAYARWIEELARRGITGGCATNPPRYCPDNAVTRGEMAVFLTANWSLPHD